MKKLWRYLSLGLLSTFLTATPGLGAERISFFYPPFGEFSLSVDSLEIFAKEGKITDELAFYAGRANPQQLAQLRELLQERFNVTPTLVSQVTYSPIGEDLIQGLGSLLRNESRQNGFFALRSALILAAADPEGLTVTNLLRQFPSRTVRLNFTEGLKIVDDLLQVLQKRDEVVTWIQQEAIASAKSIDSLNAAAHNANIDFAQLPDLRSPGSFTWQRTELILTDKSRASASADSSVRIIPTDLYLPAATALTSPEDSSPPFPVIVISHGVASDRSSFAYLAEHLASYGFAVAVLEHPGSNAERVERYLTGLAGPLEAEEFINRPLDIKFLLDELERREKSNPELQGKLNLQQVGVIGQSFGGYTVLTLAGANINFQQLQKDCGADISSFNLSLFLQCQVTELEAKNYLLQDDRIKAVVAINPLSSSIFGESQISQIQVPVMLVASSQDIATPIVSEQVRPFTWLATPNKYLVLIENATHFSAIAEPTPENGVLPIPPALLGPNPAPAYDYLKALNVAFWETHLLNRSEYAPYLQPSYAQYLSQAPLNLSLLKSLSPDQLNQALNAQSLTPSSPQFTWALPDGD
ncbi:MULTISPECIES: alpha/beta hydrolase [unclassified Nodularia (in: cyanobacteria)]|uniref:alpha/beta hydrolase n=1 Tax=unclassified Nodularia (in: cyanobacteria) TaxID=2656917 RepID=UPI001880A031|nr:MULTISPECIES: alpha/beta hydrolase [unclassified Nodularia (in: cyanobacteria)]MBE9197572.1 alpha/beta hydrolase [Nodularia sp. LEGE 06071]MCC2693952.1 alpha/beta hydrolase [Nodularia sp. LEGE 04288]